MKKTLKVMITAAILLLAGGAGILYYFSNMMEYEVADAKVDEITKSEYQIDLPDMNAGAEGVVAAEPADADAEGTEETIVGDTLVLNTGDSKVSSSGTIVNSKAQGQNKAAVNGADAKEERAKANAIDPSKTISEDKEPKKPAVSAETIKASYRPVFESLEAQANSKIDGLVSAAYSEYQAKKENGESVSITYFYRKYSTAGKELENKTDETFQLVYRALEKDLEKRGFSPSEAREFKTQYENAKAARESALFEKAKSKL